ncbi:MAG TPA: toxin-antitoxin system YwqK family antitoxin [Bacteroidales bacterium]|jgi:antitoxin component YwqK of YwqJK toxin-antitoxin module|nr:toxin-antitoxin system YwqK family antitoxin [Bacteroidales bacterium]HRT00010.1 toxin-antitoxin system YwqK family antitoxin [Bacteroidales bacterium]HRT80283.1 toxin-antitoxin system YwqK family antitoxin [Bacteroidales bacterium]
MMKKFSLTVIFVFTCLFIFPQVGIVKNDTLINYVDINKNKQGCWEKYYDNGQLRYKGFFIDDKPTGVFTYYHPNGKIKSILNYDEKGFATVEQYWENGNIAAKGFYNDKNQRIKKWYLYFEDGVLSSIINYEDGIADGPVTIFYPETGKTALECNYKDGKLNGKYRKIFPNGNTHEEGQYIDGYREGHWKVYDPTGFLEEEGPYVKSKRHGDWIVYKDRKTPDTITYTFDKPENYDEIVREWQEREKWAKENQHLFKQPEDYLDNPFEFFKPSRDPRTQLDGSFPK